MTSLKEITHFAVTGKELKKKRTQGECYADPDGLVGANGLWIKNGLDAILLASINKEVFPELGDWKENVKHLRDCWNACEGINPLAVPDLWLACETIKGMIDRGELVRDISEDSNPEYHSRMIGFVKNLQILMQALTKAKEGRPL